MTHMSLHGLDRSFTLLCSLYSNVAVQFEMVIANVNVDCRRSALKREETKQRKQVLF